MSSYRRYNYRAYPTQGQREALSCLYGACRYAYNWTLDQRELMRRRHGRMQSYTQLSGMFTQWKTNPGMEWLLAVSSTPLQQSIRHADVAYRVASGGRSPWHAGIRASNTRCRTRNTTRSAWSMTGRESDT